jgi:hypothetical protein
MGKKLKIKALIPMLWELEGFCRKPVTKNIFNVDTKVPEGKSELNFEGPIFC